MTRILEAGRWAGSAKNTQPWRFIVVRNRETLNRLSGCGNYASHLREAPLAIVVVQVPFVLTHIGKPDIELWSTFLGGSIFAWCRTRSTVTFAVPPAGTKALSEPVIR